MKMAKPKYDVTTWDSELQKWTPQEGVRRGPYTRWGLKRALRKLRAIGYPCNYQSRHYGWGDPSVSVSRIWTDEEIAQMKLATV
jgi:hypothetical protein